MQADAEALTSLPFLSADGSTPPESSVSSGQARQEGFPWKRLEVTSNQPTTTDETSCLSPSPGHLLSVLPEPGWLSRKWPASGKMSRCILSVWPFSPFLMGHGTWLQTR